MCSQWMHCYWPCKKLWSTGRNAVKIQWAMKDSLFVNLDMAKSISTKEMGAFMKCTIPEGTKCHSCGEEKLNRTWLSIFVIKSNDHNGTVIALFLHCFVIIRYPLLLSVVFDHLPNKNCLFIWSNSVRFISRITCYDILTSMHILSSSSVSGRRK